MRNRSGFTLLEVIIAIAILATSLLALLGWQSSSFLQSAKAHKVLLSSQLARAKMAQTLIDLEAGIAKGEFPEDKAAADTFEEEKYPDYYWRLSVKKIKIPAPPVPEGGSDIMAKVFEMIAEQLSEATREVTLTVGWKGLDDDEEVEGLVLTTHIVKM